MENVQLQVREREGRGKNDARRVRTEGLVPAVLYKDGKESIPLAVPAKAVDYALQHTGDNTLYDLQIGASRKKVTARIVDLHRNPVTDQLIHVDFAPVSMTEVIEVAVPVHIVGEAPGVEQEGGVLQHVLYEVHVESLPGDIPQELELDVSNLAMGENLTVGDIRLPEGVALASDPEEVVVTITPPTQITQQDIEEAGIVEEQPEDTGEEETDSGSDS